MYMRRLLCCALVFRACARRSTARDGVAKASAQRQSTLEQGILREVNRVSAGHGLRSLTLSRGLQAAATFQTRSLLSQGVFDHDTPAADRSASGCAVSTPSRAHTRGASARTCSGARPASTPARAVKLWLDSARHRKILLDPTWREFGIGAFGVTSAPGVYASAGAVVVVTIDFGSRTRRGRPQQPRTTELYGLKLGDGEAAVAVHVRIDVEREPRSHKTITRPSSTISRTMPQSPTSSPDDASPTETSSIRRPRERRP